MDEKISSPKTGRPKTRRPVPAAGREAAPFTAELEASLPNPPSDAAREQAKGPAAPRERQAADSPGQARTSDTESPRQPRFDRIVDYREDLAADFDAITSEHPRYAVLGALALGVGIGFLAALLLARE